MTSSEVKSTVKVFGYLSKQTNISHLELPLIMAGAIFLKQMKVSLPSSCREAGAILESLRVHLYSRSNMFFK